MPGRGPENIYIGNIDAQNRDTDREGQIGEWAIMEITKKVVPDLIIRYSSPEEDAGSKRIGKGKSTDLVSYWSDKPNTPSIAIQASVAEGRQNIAEKFNLLKNEPFTHIEGKATPRAIVILNRSEAMAFNSDNDLEQHKKLVIEYFDWLIKSLRFGEQVNKDPKQRIKATEAIKRLEDTRDQWLKTKNRPN